MTEYRHKETVTPHEDLTQWMGSSMLGQVDRNSRGSAGDEMHKVPISAEASPPFEPNLPDELEESPATEWPRRDDEASSSDPRKPR